MRITSFASCIFLSLTSKELRRYFSAYVLVKEGVLGAILLIVGVFDRLYIDWYWVGRTKVWIIPGTEDLMPCMPQSDRGARRVSWWHGAIVWRDCSLTV